MTDASDRGWGPGWPNCQPDQVEPFESFGVGFPAGVRHELAPLLSLLLGHANKRGFQLMEPGCWGYACRPIKRSDGTLTDVPSNHSWGLAIDVNAPRNVFGAPRSSSEIATKYPWLPKLMADYGFRWGGNYTGTKDWMHFEFMGTPRAARRATRRAKANFLDVDFRVVGTGIDRVFEDYRDAAAFVRARLLASKPITRLVIRRVTDGADH